MDILEDAKRATARNSIQFELEAKPKTGEQPQEKTSERGVHLSERGKREPMWWETETAKAPKVGRATKIVV